MSKNTSDTIRGNIDAGAFNFKNINAGIYNLTLKDANGCALYLPVKIEEAQAFDTFILGSGTGKDSVCVGQETILDVKNQGKTIRWFYNGVERAAEQANRDKPQYTVVTPGKYTVEIKNATGCNKRDSIEIKNSPFALKTDFLIPTQAFVGDTVVALDITVPVPDLVVWFLPSEVQVIKKDRSRCFFVPATEGIKKIGLLAKSGECKNTVFRDIKIFDPANVDQTDSSYHYLDQQITNAIIYPNPNQGVFLLKVNLKNPLPLIVNIYRVQTGELVFGKTLQPTTTDKDAIHNYPFNLDLLQGNYTMVLEIGTQKVFKHIIITND